MVTLEVSQCFLSCGATRVTKNMMLCRWQSFLFSSLFFLSSNWNSCCTIHNSNLSSHFITILNLIIILLIINFSFGSFCNLFFTPQPSILSCPHFFFQIWYSFFWLLFFILGLFVKLSFCFQSHSSIKICKLSF